MYAGPNIPVFLLMIWLPVAGFVTVVYLVAYGIAYKRRGLIAAGASVFAAMVGLGVIAALLFASRVPTSRASVSFDSSTATLTATSDRNVVSFPEISSMFSGGGFHFDGMHISFGKMLVLAVLALVAIRVFSRRGRWDKVDDRQRGWGLGRFILLVLIVMFAARVWSASKERSAREWAQQEQKQAEHDRREVERARHHVAATASPVPSDFQASIEQLWDKLNQPKIDLHAPEHSGTTKISAGSTTAEQNALKSTDGLPDQATDSGSRTTAESLARSAVELGRVVAQVSTLAQQVSDASRLIARALADVDRSTDKLGGAPAVRPKTSAIANTRESATSAKPVAPKDVAKHTARDGELNEKIGGEVPANKPRPTWVDEPQKQVGNVLRQVVVAGPYTTPEECYAKTDELLKMATDDHVKQTFGGMRDGHLMDAVQAGSPLVKIMNFKSAALDRMGIGVSFIRHEIAKDEYLETVERSIGPMKNLYTLLEFSPDVDRDLRVRWNEFQRDARVTAIGLLSGSIIGVIGLAFGLLRIDTATKGYYSKRLFLGVPAAIIGVITLAAVFGRW